MNTLFLNFWIQYFGHREWIETIRQKSDQKLGSCAMNGQKTISSMKFRLSALKPEPTGYFPYKSNWSTAADPPEKILFYKAIPLFAALEPREESHRLECIFNVVTPLFLDFTVAHQSRGRARSRGG